MKCEQAVQFAIEAAKRVQKDYPWKEMTEEEFLTAFKGEMEKLIGKYGRVSVTHNVACEYHVLYYTKEQEFCFDPSPHSYVVSGEKALSEIMEYVGDGRIVAILKEPEKDRG